MYYIQPIEERCRRCRRRIILWESEHICEEFEKCGDEREQRAVIRQYHRLCNACQKLENIVTAVYNRADRVFDGSKRRV